MPHTPRVWKILEMAILEPDEVGEWLLETGRVARALSVGRADVVQGDGNVPGLHGGDDDMIPHLSKLLFLK